MITKLGSERAMMMSPLKFGQFIKGSENIDNKLRQGWSIVESERNHLLPHRLTGSQEKNGSTGLANEPFEAEVVEVPQQVAVQQKGKRKRIQRH